MKDRVEFDSLFSKLDATLRTMADDAGVGYFFIQFDVSKFRFNGNGMSEMIVGVLEHSLKHIKGTCDVCRPNVVPLTKEDELAILSKPNDEDDDDGLPN